MASDSYTMDMRLCDNDGVVSHNFVEDGKDNETYLDRLNRLRNMTLRSQGNKEEWIGDPFNCTGHAHLAGEHIRCTSSAHHTANPATFVTTAQLMTQFPIASAGTATIRKVADLPAPCLHTEHYPPSMIVLAPGVYEHTCPGCGFSSRFTVAGTYCLATA